MLERLGDFDKANDLSAPDLNLYEFEVGSRKVYVAWTSTGNTVDLSQQLPIGRAQLKITHIVTELDDNGRPVAVADEIQSSTSVYLSNTPIIISPWIGNGADLNDDGVVNKVDISIAANAFGTKPGDLNWNEKADLNKNGTINILDICAVAKAFGGI
jgi:hypothetical protein